MRLIDYEADILYWCYKDYIIRSGPSDGDTDRLYAVLDGITIEFLVGRHGCEEAVLHGNPYVTYTFVCQFRNKGKGQATGV